MIETTLDGQTADITEQNIQKLKEIFPDAFCEGKVDFDKLQQILGNFVEDSKERYNFSWNGKGKALKLAQSPSTGTLLPCKEESKDWDTTENMYIEGDNLEVLKLLQKSYHNKIKMIYIDPPYNTGHDFVYPDNFKDNLENYLEITGQTDDDGKKLSTNSESNGRYHTDWLNMMYPRLRLARNLLCDDGVIFISIDDNEQINLRKICDEVFGEDNFIGVYVKQSKVGGGSDTKFIVKEHEYCIVYAKNTDKANEMFVKHDDDYLKRYKEIDENGRYFWDTFARPGLKNPIHYDIVAPDGTIMNYGWIHGKERFEEEYKSGIVRIISKNNGEWSVQFKQYLNESGKKPRSLTMDFGGSIEGKNDIGILFDNDKLFSYPKSVKFLSTLFKTICSSNDIILDFFSGSATAAHAVMQLNAEDGGKRKFIMVQFPEPCDEKSEAYKAGYKNICEIGKERIRRAGAAISAKCEERNVELKKKQLSLEDNSAPNTPSSKLDIGFKVFKLNSSNIRKWDLKAENIDKVDDYIASMINNFVDGRCELDVVYEIMIKYGLDLTYPVEEIDCNGTTLYSIGMGMLLIILAKNISTDVAKFVVNYKKENEVEEMRVVFADSCFCDNDSLKTNIKEILKIAKVEEFITI